MKPKLKRAGGYTDEQLVAICRQFLGRRGYFKPRHIWALAYRFLEMHGYERPSPERRRNALRVVNGGKRIR